MGSLNSVDKKNLRNNFDSEEMIGIVNEDELSNLSGAGDVQPQTTWPCAVFTIVSAAQCPTTACSSKCTK